MTKQKYTSLLKLEEIIQIFQTGYLYELGSFHFIEKENSASYDVNRDKSHFLEESKLIYNKYQNGHTIIVKNLEYFNEEIRIKAAQMGPKTDVHMYLVPPNGDTSFAYHQDTRDVLVHMVYGEKIFYIKDANTHLETKYHLSSGKELFLPMAHWHKAIPVGASCLLSFGKEKLPIHYDVPTQFNELDFHTML